MTERTRGTAYAHCVGCGRVAVHTDEQMDVHCWIDRSATDEERARLAGLICIACMPKPTACCMKCLRVAYYDGPDMIWRGRRATPVELATLPRVRCTACTPTPVSRAS